MRTRVKSAAAYHRLDLFVCGLSCYSQCFDIPEQLKAVSWPSLFQPPDVWISALVRLPVGAIVSSD